MALYEIICMRSIAQASCWQPLFINKATFSTIHCSQSVVHVTDPRTRHVNACREWKATHKNVMSHFSLFSFRLAYKQQGQWDETLVEERSAQDDAQRGLEKCSIVVCVCVCFALCTGSLRVTRYCCHETVAYNTASCFCVILMYKERILIHATLRQVHLYFVCGLG